MNVKDITVTKGRAKEAIEGGVTKVFGTKVSNQINNAVAEERIRTGVITKFYPYLDKAEVKLDNVNKKIICKILHRFGGDLIDFYTPSSSEKSFDDNLKEPCIIPRAAQHVCVLSIHDADSAENIILGYYQNEEVVGMKPAEPGNMKLTSITEPNLYWLQFGKDGLDLRLPKQATTNVGVTPNTMENVEYTQKGDVYTKDEVDNKLKKDCNTYADLLNVAENYHQKTEDMYTLFRGDCWTVNNNYESSAAVTSETTSDVTITGTFRTKNDLIGLYWNSEDPIQHPYISYGKRTDYTGVTLDFDYSMTGCKDFSDGVISITMAKTDGSVYYFTMNRFISNGHFSIDFDELTLLAGNQYINKYGQPVLVEETTPVSPKDIKYIMFVIVPTNFVQNNTEYTIMNNVDYKCEITNISVRNGDICKEHVALEPHKYRICEGYDDFYNVNPKRIAKEMRKLGYTKWCDLYIGASHYYEKSGTPGETITIEPDFNHNRTEKMVLNPDVPLNKAFKAWLDCYSKELNANDCPNLIISVSMENLQCPHEWRQKGNRGTEDNPEGWAMTGWIPSTFFYSPCNPEPVAYMQSVSEACLDIVVANEMQPILQMGEAWWWWQESYHPVDEHGEPIDVDHWQFPCFYDDATKAKYLEEFGKPLPVYDTAWRDFDEETTYWLNQQLVGYVDKLREVVKSERYTNGLYLALFFPPSVADPDRVPKMMKEANYIKAAYHPTKLDILQLEDYDWVTGNPLEPETKDRDRSHHPKVYSMGEELGFEYTKQHYFGGFVQYERDAVEFWKLIKDAMDEAISKGFAEVFVWAGSQIRRDKKMIGYDDYELVQLLNQK